MGKNAYRPEEPRPGTEAKTNQRNVQNAYAILNRLANKIDKIENSTVVGGGGIVTPGMLNDSKEFAFMMGMI